MLLIIILNKIRERITNNSIIKSNKENPSTTKNQYKKIDYKYKSTHKNKSLDYDSDNDRKNHCMNNSSMNNIYESEESISSQFNSSVEKDNLNNKNNSVNYESNNITEDENGIYQKNKNITTPELGSKYNNIFTKNSSNKYDNDDDHFLNDNLPISVNLTNFDNITEQGSKRSDRKDTFGQKEKMLINFNETTDRKKSKNISNPKNDKILYNTIFSPKTSIPKKNKNKISKKTEISVKDNKKLNKEIWNLNNKKNKTNNSLFDINVSKLDINNADNEKNKNQKNYLNNTQIQFSLDNNENNKLNKSSINIYKKNINKDLKEKREMAPLDLNCILNLTNNEIKSRTKNFFKKFGFFFNERDNVIKVTRAGTIIEITLFKIGDGLNNIYFNTRIKTSDFKKEKEIMRKLLNSLNKKE